jgi:hypothetical protein
MFLKVREMLIIETLKICVQVNEDNIKKAAEKLSNSTYVSTEPSRGKSSGRELTRNATTANLKKNDNKSLIRQPSSRTLKSNKSTLNITTDDTLSSKEPKTPAKELKRNVTVGSFNKTPLKQRPTNTSDKKEDKKEDNSKLLFNIESLKRTPTAGKLNTAKKDDKNSKIFNIRNHTH